MTGTAVVILAAGSGSRVGRGTNKVLLPLRGRPMVAWSVGTSLDTPSVVRVVVVVREGEQSEVAAAIARCGIADPRVSFAVGGASRHASEWHGIDALSGMIEAGNLDVVAIHDAARPWASVDLFTRVIEAARNHGGAVPVLDLVDVAMRDGTELPEHVAAVQTPQAFRADALLSSYAAADRDGFTGTDTASCVEEYAPDGVRVAAVEGDPDNRKITHPGDLESAG